MCSRRPFLCVWKPRPVPLCVGLLAPLSAPLPSAVFFLAILRRALGIPPSTALAERQSPAALALVVERSSPASAVASFGQSSHYQPVGVLCAAGQRFANGCPLRARGLAQSYTKPFRLRASKASAGG